MSGYCKGCGNTLCICADIAAQPRCCECDACANGLDCTLFKEPHAAPPVREYWTDGHELYQANHADLPGLYELVERSAYDKLAKERDDYMSVLAGVEEQAKKNSEYDEWRIEKLRAELAEANRVTSEACVMASEAQTRLDAAQAELAEAKREIERLGEDLNAQVDAKLALKKQVEWSRGQVTSERTQLEVEKLLKELAEAKRKRDDVKVQAMGKIDKAREERDAALAEVERVKKVNAGAVELAALLEKERDAALTLLTQAKTLFQGQIEAGATEEISEWFIEEASKWIKDAEGMK